MATNWSQEKCDDLAARHQIGAAAKRTGPALLTWLFHHKQKETPPDMPPPNGDKEQVELSESEPT